MRDLLHSQLGLRHEVSRALQEPRSIRVSPTSECVGVLPNRASMQMLVENLSAKLPFRPEVVEAEHIDIHPEDSRDSISDKVVYIDADVQLGHLGEGTVRVDRTPRFQQVGCRFMTVQKKE